MKCRDVESIFEDVRRAYEETGIVPGPGPGRCALSALGELEEGKGWDTYGYDHPEIIGSDEASAVIDFAAGFDMAWGREIEGLPHPANEVMGRGRRLGTLVVYRVLLKRPIPDTWNRAGRTQTEGTGR